MSAVGEAPTERRQPADDGPTGNPPKVIVLGIDSAIAQRVYELAQAGHLPTLRKLMDTGVHAPNCLVPFPTITPPNWTSIATGAWPGTHGITDIASHTPGTPLNQTHNAFDSSEIQAETIWESAERAGKRSIIVNYPTAWPSRVKDGWVISGVGGNVNDWRPGFPPGVRRCNLTDDFLLATEAFPFASKVELRAASGWSGVKHSASALEAEVQIRFRRTLFPMDPVTWYLLVDRSDGQAFDTVIVAKSKSEKGVYARLRAGQWSANLHDTFATDSGPRRGVFRCKLVELSADASALRLFVPGICGLEGWGYPSAIEAEIRSDRGLPTARAGWESYLLEWIDLDTVVEVMDLMTNWLADASVHLLSTKPWDLFFLHVHSTDWLYHSISPELDPTTARDASAIPRFRDIERRIYEGVDRCFADVLAAVPTDSTVVVTSDHGAKPTTNPFSVERVLESTGLLNYVADEVVEDGSEGTRLAGGTSRGVQRRVDWSRTKAYPQRTVYVYVNVKGRDPDGAVEPGEEYERVVDDVISALYSWTDAKTGLKPVTLALRRQDARILGLYGDRVGDVIYALDPRFGKEHGFFLTTARYGVGDLRGLFIMAGPGVRRGVALDRNVWLTDIAPTLCFLAEIPIPRDCEGSVLYQALEDPDRWLRELQTMRRNVERLQRVEERRTWSG